jgi:hypothetical protein
MPYVYSAIAASRIETSNMGRNQRVTHRSAEGLIITEIQYPSLTVDRAVHQRSCKRRRFRSALSRQARARYDMRLPRDVESEHR